MANGRLELRLGVKLLVVSALSEEQEALRKKYGAGHAQLVSVTSSYWLGITGDGAWAAERTLRRWIKEIGPTHVVVIGLAGGLSPSLKPGMLIQGKEVIGPRRSYLLEPWFPRDSKVIQGTILSSSRILGSVADKARCWEANQQPEVALVDLESMVYASVAYEEKVKLSILRVVSDGADEDLPKEIIRSVTKQGSVRRWQVAARAIINPGVWPTLMALRSRVKIASEQLTRAIAKGEVWVEHPTL